MKLPSRSAAELQEGRDLCDLARRLATWKALGEPADVRFQAIFGEAEQQTTISDVLDAFVHETRDESVKRNPREIDKKLNAKRQAIGEPIAFLKADAMMPSSSTRMGSIASCRG